MGRPLTNKAVLLASAILGLMACGPSTVGPGALAPESTSTASSPTDVIQGTATPNIPPGAVSTFGVNGAEVSYQSADVTVKAYLARPKEDGPFPGLIIIHENRGLTPHIEDVARRYANLGYVVLAPDLLSRSGGTHGFTTTSEATSAISKLDQAMVMEDLNAAVAALKADPNVLADHIGVLGYCWGGGNSLLLATRNKELRAAVVYYGPNPVNIDEVANITAPVLGIYGERDTRITVNVGQLEAAMQKHGKTFEYAVYPEAAHAFFNDTSASYNAEAAAQAWEKTTAFLEKTLKR